MTSTVGVSEVKSRSLAWEARGCFVPDLDAWVFGLQVVDLVDTDAPASKRVLATVVQRHDDGCHYRAYVWSTREESTHGTPGGAERWVMDRI